jgi:predicted  nucleic acid-binding Zn-ribbon protein
LKEKLRGAETAKLSLEADIAVLREAVAERKMEAEREARKKERLEKEMKELRASLEARQGEIKSKQQQVRLR